MKTSDWETLFVSQTAMNPREAARKSGSGPTIAVMTCIVGLCEADKTLPTDGDFLALETDDVESQAPMNVHRPERRRAARVRLSPGCRLPFGMSFPAQVIEINLSGVLLGSTTDLPIGERGELRATIGGR